MIAAERKMYIMKQLDQKSIVSLKQLALEIGASEITVRRDLEKLENEGKLKRVPGGATLEHQDSVEMTMSAKAALNAGAKRLVAKRAAEEVREGECVFLDGGTTTAPMIDFLAERKVTIVTYSQLVLCKLVNPVAEIHVIGGRFVPHYGMNVGPEAQESLKRYHFDHAFLGCTGVTLDSNMSYITNMESLLMKKIAMENSSQNYLLLDSSKFQKPSFLKFVELDAFDQIFCNRTAESAENQRIQYV